MADTFVTNVVQHQHDNDNDVLYGCLRNPAGQIRDIINGAWIAHPEDGESLDDCDISAATPTGYLWSGSFPVEVDDGFYIYQIRKRAGDEAEYADLVVGAVKGYWNGTVFSEENQTLAVIGTPADIDSGGATIADNLKKFADNNGGADFSSATDSLEMIAYRVNNIVSTGSAINVSADSFQTPPTKGTVVSGTLANTVALDETYHQIADDSSDMDIEYGFTIASDAVPVSVTLTGRLTGNNDSLAVQAYNWETPGWDQVGILSGINQSVDSEHVFNLFTSHVGTGNDSGSVRIRFYGTDLSNANLYVDQLFLSYAVVHRSVGYSDGSIWVDTINGKAGTTAFINGTADNPVNTWADALSISSSLGLRRFSIFNGSSIELTNAITNYTLLGHDWTLDFSGEDSSDAHIEGATVSGISPAETAEVHLRNCRVGNVTLGTAHLVGCGLFGTFTLGAATDYILEECYNNTNGVTPPIIDFAAVGNSHVALRGWFGGIRIKNLGQNGVDIITIVGMGKLVIDETCIGGTIKVTGNFTIEDETTDGFLGTLEEDARYDIGQITDAMKEMTGITEGGTWQFDKVVKIITAWIAGNWRLKETDTTKQELLDPDDGTTVILEQSLTHSPDAGSNYRDITVKI